MRLSIRDGVATLLAVAAVLIAVATVQPWNWPLLTSYRWGTAALFVVGLLMCATGSSAETYTRPDGFTVLSALLGVVALGFVVYGFVAGTALGVVGLVVAILALWLVTTLHHIVTPEGGRTTYA